MCAVCAHGAKHHLAAEQLVAELRHLYEQLYPDSSHPCLAVLTATLHSRCWTHLATALCLTHNPFLLLCALPVNPDVAFQAPAAGMIKCRVQQGSSAVSSLCDGDVLYDDGMQAHITVWHQTAAAAGPSQPGSVSGAAAGSLTSSADGAWDAVSVFGRHRRRQQHRKLVRFV